METNKLKISTKSNPNAVAGAMIEVLRNHKTVELLTVGAGALNQAIKSIAVARGYIAPSGRNLVCIPAFTEVVLDEMERTGIRLIVKEEV